MRSFVLAVAAALLSALAAPALATPDLASGTAAEECLACHDAKGHAHPMDRDYALARVKDPRGLRPLEDVRARGVLVPEGRVVCVSCHDAKSPWANHIALPPGAPAIEAAPSGPGTAAERPNWRILKAEELPPLPPGTAVSSAPLCAACHTMAD